MKKRLTACLFVILLTLQAHSQNYVNGGKVFQVIIPFGAGHFDLGRILICANELTQVIVTKPLGAGVAYYPIVDTIIMQPNTCDTVYFAGANNLGCLIKDTTTIIQADKPINVWQFNGGDSLFNNNPVHANVTTSLVFPIENAGTDFYYSIFSVPWFPPNFNYPTAGNIWVVALEDSTHIEIVPTSDVKCNIAQIGVPFQIWMNKGEYFATQPKVGSDSTFNGSYIHSLAVNGHRAKFTVYANLDAIFNPNTPWANHPLIQHNILPVSLWSTSYHAVPLLTRDSTLYLLQSAFDSTVVTINGSVYSLFNTGEHGQVLLNTPSVIEANNPFSIVQVSREAVKDSVVNSNGFLYQLLGDSQVLTHAVFRSEFYARAMGAIDTEFVCIITKTAFANMVVLDSVNIGSQFTAFPTDASYSYAQVSVGNAVHILHCDSGCIAYLYGWGYFNGYGNIIGGVNELVTDIAEVAVNPYQLTIYPNPAKDICTITSNSFIDAQLFLYDIAGRQLLQQPFTKQTQLNISRLCKGIYLLEIKGRAGSAINKFVKE